MKGDHESDHGAVFSRSDHGAITAITEMTNLQVKRSRRSITAITGLAITITALSLEGVIGRRWRLRAVAFKAVAPRSDSPPDGAPAAPNLLIA